MRVFEQTKILLGVQKSSLMKSLKASLMEWTTMGI